MSEQSNSVFSDEFLLMDRIQKIRSIVKKYGEDSFYISFSGGKDSTVLSHLVDLSIPGNRIPRVYANTGIEYSEIIKFVQDEKEKDDRIVILKPSVSVRNVCETYGYPFKSKEHSSYVDIFQRNGETETTRRYLNPAEGRKSFGCPEILKYQFSDAFRLHLSSKCCDKMKKEPMLKWSAENDRKNVMVGILGDEKGQRNSAKCIVPKNGGIHFQPLIAVNSEWERWFIEKYNIRLCKLYYTPYNFERTGCKGCPYNIKLQETLNELGEFFPAERKQCEILWKPVYDEYRRLGYRLKKDPYRGKNDIDGQMTIDDLLFNTGRK